MTTFVGIIDRLEKGVKSVRNIIVSFGKPDSKSIYLFRGGFLMGRVLDAIVLTISIIGAINWGLIGFFNFNLVGFIFGADLMSRIIYAIVGLCGIYLLTFYGKTRQMGNASA